MLVSLVYVVVCRLFALVPLLARGERSKELEILVLRHELSVLRRQVKRPRFEPGDRCCWRRSAGCCRAAPGVSSSCGRRRFLRWHRRLVARHWTYPHAVRAGRRSAASARADVRLARENTSWGYMRIVGELRKLGIDVSATLVRNVLSAAGLPPAPRARPSAAWRSFLRAQRRSILACDFFTVDTSAAPAVRTRVHLASAAAGSSTSPARANPTRRGCSSRRATC